jgi:pyridoxine 5-phosphate synthase
VLSHREAVATAVERLRQAGIAVSLFLDADPRQIEVAAQLGAHAVELHTGQYSLAKGQSRQDELAKLIAAGRQIRDLRMALHAGHGLNYQNVRPVANIEGMHELNIGHAIVARAIMVGMQQAVREMKNLVG